MNNDKNLINNNGTVDEELLRSFFAGSVHMQIVDDGFSHRVMQRLQKEMPARERMIYNVWTALWAVACVAAFVVWDGIGIIKGYLGRIAAFVADMLPNGDFRTLMSQLDFNTFMSHVQASSSTVLMAIVTVVVLGSVALWDAAEQ